MLTSQTDIYIFKLLKLAHYVCIEDLSISTFPSLCNKVAELGVPLKGRYQNDDGFLESLEALSKMIQTKILTNIQKVLPLE